MPPESYITPLPTKIKCGSFVFVADFFADFFAALRVPLGRYEIFTMRGGFTLPRFTPMIPPQPIANS